jgi:uncharacterized membrane protein
MRAKNKLFFVVAFLCLALFPFHSLARENVFDWYIQNFQVGILVNPDSSLLITERITADCGNAPGKHGIFRVLPTQTNTSEGTIKTPIKLISITDFNDRPLKYSTTNNPFDHTVTWKIGDPNKTVSGVNYYKIVYQVKNAILFNNPSFDELYWNLNGSFWDLETDSFTANLVFPSEVTQANTAIDYYTGSLGSKDKSLANYAWVNDNVLQFSSTATLLEKEGITASVTFPKGIFTPYKPSFAEQYGNYFWFLIPLAVFVFCFKTWEKYGKDPRINKSIMPEYENPDNLSPIEMGVLLNNGQLKNELISAGIVNLAVKGIISIEEMKKSWLLAGQDFKLKKLIAKDNAADNLSPTEKLLLQSIFGAKDEILLSSLKNEFYKDLPKIEKSARSDLLAKNLITKKGQSLKEKFLGVSIFLFCALWALIVISIRTPFLPIEFIINVIVACLIAFVFAFFMPKRTEEGAALVWRLKGFKLYMETAEKYRQQFFEKENIFEKFLPYAMVFGITGLWIKKMKEIYGENYFATYHPAWYVGLVSGSFNVDSFTSTLNGISSSISSNMGSSSGAGGAGGAGGGGGGGGGGGW